MSDPIRLPNPGDIPIEHARLALALGRLAEHMLRNPRSDRQDAVAAARHPRAEWRIDDDRCDAIVSDLEGKGLLMDLAGDVILTERGRVLFQMARDKLEAAERAGESSISMSDDDRDRFMGASGDLPG
jgi:hypothetical protein